MDKIYRDTVALLLDTLPYVFQSQCFAMKGGTAINLFCRDMPRLSVDIDLVFVDRDITDRTEALATIERNLDNIATGLRKRLNAKVQKTSSGSTHDTKLFVSRGTTRVKIEVNHVFRGSVYPPIKASLVQKAEELFEREVRISMLDPDDLYASKLVAALDRQHPRDLFDVMLLNQHGGITPRMRRAFVVYLAGHNRPMHELLPPRPHDMTEAFEKEFVGMTAEPVALETLETTRSQLFTTLSTSLDNQEKGFLLSLHRLDPDWDSIQIDGIQQLPAIKWKLKNLTILKDKNPRKFKEMLNALEQRLESV